MTKRIRDSDGARLIEATADFKRRIEKLPEFRGWSIQTRRQEDRVAVEVVDPVFAEAIGISLSLQQYATEVGRFLSAARKGKEIEALNAAPRKPTNGKLLQNVRRTASAYSWSFETFRQVVQLLFESRAIREDEFQWLLDSGPWSHTFWVGYPHSRPAWRGLPTGSAEEQYKAFRRRYLRDKRRYERTHGS
jgi:hypothetical protein